MVYKRNKLKQFFYVFYVLLMFLMSLNYSHGIDLEISNIKVLLNDNLKNEQGGYNKLLYCGYVDSTLNNNLDGVYCRYINTTTIGDTSLLTNDQIVNLITQEKKIGNYTQNDFINTFDFYKDTNNNYSFLIKDDKYNLNFNNNTIDDLITKETLLSNILNFIKSKDKSKLILDNKYIESNNLTQKNNFNIGELVKQLPNNNVDNYFKINNSEYFGCKSNYCFFFNEDTSKIKKGTFSNNYSNHTIIPITINGKLNFLSLNDTLNKNITITFNKNLGTGGTNTLVATYGQTLSNITIPTKTKNNFLGYFTSSTGGTKLFDKNGIYIGGVWNDNQNLELFAQWEEILDMSPGDIVLKSRNVSKYGYHSVSCSSFVPYSLFYINGQGTIKVELETYLSTYYTYFNGQYIVKKNGSQVFSSSVDYGYTSTNKKKHSFNLSVNKGDILTIELKTCGGLLQNYGTVYTTTTLKGSYSDNTFATNN